MIKFLYFSLILIVLFPAMGFSQSTLKTVNPMEKWRQKASKENFQRLVDQLHHLYKGKIKKTLGLDFSIVFNEINNKHAFAYQDPIEKIAEVNFYRGYIEDKKATKGSTLIILCHEIGHHLGGEPRKVSKTGRKYWSSMEGQADYFAPECAKLVLEKNGITSNVKLKEILIQASKDTLSVLRPDDPFDEKIYSIKKAKKIIERDLSSQCRFDTFRAGINKSLNLKPMRRPKCWYPMK